MRTISLHSPIMTVFHSSISSQLILIFSLISSLIRLESTPSLSYLFSLYFFYPPYLFYFLLLSLLLIQYQSPPNWTIASIISSAFILLSNHIVELLAQEILSSVCHRLVLSWPFLLFGRIRIMSCRAVIDVLNVCHRLCSVDMTPSSKTFKSSQGSWVRIPHLAVLRLNKTHFNVVLFVEKI